LIRLRLQRKGRKKRPYFHIVAADQRSPRDGRVIERLGRYDNVSERKELIVDEERIIHWLRIGAQPSDTVRSLLKREGILYKMHLIRWGKSEEEIEQALAEWKEARSTSASEDEVSRKARQKALLEAEGKEYKKQLEEKAAEAARKAKAKKADAEAEKAKEDAETTASEEVAAEVPVIEEAPVIEDEPAAVEETPVAAEKEVDLEAEAEAETVTEEAPAKEEEAKEEPVSEVGEEIKAEEKQEEATEKEEAPASTGKVSTDMTANEAIDHIKNTPLEELKGFVPENEERVTVQRAWESKQAE